MSAAHPLATKRTKRAGSTRTPRRECRLDRYTACYENFVPVTSTEGTPYSGPRRAQRAKRTESTSQGFGTSWDIKGESPWLVGCSSVSTLPVCVGFDGEPEVLVLIKGAVRWSPLGVDIVNRPSLESCVLNRALTTPHAGVRFRSSCGLPVHRTFTRDRYSASGR